MAGLDELSVSVTSVGSGDPTLIFVHGLGGDRSNWAAQVKSFASRYRVVTFDLPGHGRAWLAPDAGFESLALFLLAVRARYGGSSVILVGHSLGCRVILEAMARGCAGVVGVVLIEQNLVGGDDAHRAAQAVQARIDTVGVHNFLIAGFRPMFNASSSPELRDAILSGIERLDPAFATRLVVESIRWEASVAKQLSGLTAPVLLIQSTFLDTDFTWHSLQPGMSTAWTRLVLQQARHAQLQVIPGVGHFAQVEAASEINRLIGEFVDSLITGLRH